MSALMERMAYHYGQDAKGWNYQRVVPKAFVDYADIWLAGYDGKPIKNEPNNNWMEVELWGGDFDDKQDAELERKNNTKPVAIVTPFC